MILMNHDSMSLELLYFFFAGSFRTRLMQMTWYMSVLS